MYVPNFADTICDHAEIQDYAQCVVIFDIMCLTFDCSHWRHATYCCGDTDTSSKFWRWVHCPRIRSSWRN